MRLLGCYLLLGTTYYAAGDTERLLLKLLPCLCFLFLPHGRSPNFGGREGCQSSCRVSCLSLLTL